MGEEKKETSARTEVSKRCPRCDFIPVEATDCYCGKCGTKLV